MSEQRARRDGVVATQRALNEIKAGDDAAEQPADIIRTADLLMRMLDDIAPAEPRPASHGLAAPRSEPPARLDV